MGILSKLAWYYKGMKSLFSKLLPFFFLAMLSLAPLNAQAADYGPTGPRDGMFDCLGNLDWGCRIISFLFEGTENGNDNSVTYVKDGKEVVERPTAVMAALRGMMAFFSNALLIVASIKLLYELIQMTAESAQTGQVGGKNANKLWAPIRLVIAIGLLVPLDTGLNSGQYIVLQIAKWGSGLASQGWKVFVEKLTENQTLSDAIAPRILGISENLLKSYICQRLTNYYAMKSETPKEMVTKITETTGSFPKVVFKSRMYDNVCGEVSFKMPKILTGTAEAQRMIELTRINNDQFNQADGPIMQEAIKIADSFKDEARTDPTVDTSGFDTAVQNYQTSLTSALKNSSVAKGALSDILNAVQNAANTRGWTSAGTWFLAIARAQGQVTTGGLNIPEVSGPNMDVLCKVKDSGPCRGYTKFLQSYEQSIRPQDASAGPSVGLEQSVVREHNDLNSFVKYATSVGGLTIDKLLGYMDSGAAAIGLWTNDPQKAFGDLGGTTNPFGEIAALGHKKIRLALDYLGIAMLTTAAGGILGFVPGIGGAAAGLSAAATAVIMMIASLFLLAGVVLAFIVPLFPFTRFFFSIMTWIGSLIEAMIVVPFMALGFLTPNGEGFAGPNTRSAFISIFQIFLRPILCVFGLIAAMLMFYVAAKFLNAMFYEATSGIGLYENSGMKFVQKLVYSVVYVGLIYVAANTSFKMIEHIPKHALGWMNASAKEESYDDHQGFMNVATAVGGGKLVEQFAGLPNTLVGAPLKALNDGKQTISRQIGASRDKKATDNAKKASDNAKQAASRSSQQDKNQNLLGMGYEQRPGTSMDQPGAMIITNASPSAIARTEDQLASREREADTLEGEISRDSAEYQVTTDPGRKAALERSIHTNISRLATLGRSTNAQLPTGIAQPAIPANGGEIKRLTDQLNDMRTERT